VVFGALELGAVFGDRKSMEIVTSTEAYIGSRSVFDADQLAIRGIERFDISVHGYGSSTVAGPIVALETADS
jgi:HK97 family phage major capsid protein